MAMQENPDNKLSYQGDEPSGASVYRMTLNGKIVFFARADKNEQDMPIYILAANRTTWIKTSSRAFLVEDNSRISAMSMKEAIYGNLPWMLADLLLN